MTGIASIAVRARSVATRLIVSTLMERICIHDAAS
jgi:hypothetical protein